MRGKNRIKPRRKSPGALQKDKPKAEESLIANGPNSPSSVSRLLCSKFSAIGFAADVEPALIADVLSCERPFACCCLSCPN
jgi:hypothetical protein